MSKYRDRVRRDILAIFLSLSASFASADAVLIENLTALTTQQGAEVGFAVDVVSFTLASDMEVTFDMLSAGAFPKGFDTQIYLAVDDGALDNLDFLAVNDDGLFGNDGSSFNLDSYFQIDLVAGEYLLAVGACCMSMQDVVDGYRIISSDTIDMLNFGGNYGDYQLTIEGDVTITAVTPVPIPAAGLFYLAALGCLGLIRARSR